MTRLPLVENQLLTRPAIQAMINARLAYHDNLLNNYLEQSPRFQAEISHDPDATVAQ